MKEMSELLYHLCLVRCLIEQINAAHFFCHFNRSSRFFFFFLHTCVCVWHIQYASS